MNAEHKARLITLFEEQARAIGAMRGWLDTNEATLNALRDEVFADVLEGDDKPRLLFASPVTGRVGDVWGATNDLKWFAATSYGKRYENRPGVWSLHTGVDLNLPDYADSGKPIYAAADGRVVFSGVVSGWQQSMVIIEHELEDGRKVWTRYAHLKNVIPIGQTVVPVKRGTVIGYVGDYAPAGTANDHCHYDVAVVDLGKKPSDWPGLDAQRLKNYLDPVVWHNERK